MASVTKGAGQKPGPAAHVGMLLAGDSVTQLTETDPLTRLGTIPAHRRDATRNARWIPDRHNNGHPFPQLRYRRQMARRHPPPPQSIRFCRSTDDVRIAYARYGQGPPLIIATCWLSHLEYDLESPVWRHWVEGMGSIATTVRYDERGFGLSDWQVPDFSFESRISDLEAVIDASGFDEFALLGMSQGGPVAMAYAHRHPERVTRLILHGSYVATLGPSMDSAEMENAFIKMVEVGWARPEGRFRRVFTDMLMPGATPEQMTWVDELMKVSTSTANAVEFRRQRLDVDVSNLLPQLDFPTLVLHARGDQMNEFSEGRRLAAEIPGARLVTLESNNHVLLEGEPAWPVFLREIDQFLEPDRESARLASSQRGHISANALERLTAREREVLELVAAGLDNTDIAAKLTLSVRTVERHLQTVYRKLDLTGSAQRTAAAALVVLDR
jgi:pimeloyl-ACP methyl ester carboxylesterase/DNA-binding CsgD family transcriptional regulator